MLRRYFENLQMSNSKTINDFFTRANQINSHGDTLDDQKVVENILRSLPIIFGRIVVPIEESKYLSQVSIQIVLWGLYKPMSKDSICQMVLLWKIHSNHKFKLAAAKEEEESLIEVEEDLEEE